MEGGALGSLRWKPLTDDEEEKLAAFSSSHKPGSMVRYEPLGTLFWKDSLMARIKEFSVRDGDVWVVTPPKCGTTWMQEIAWLALNDVDPTGAAVQQFYRCPFLEWEVYNNHIDQVVCDYPEGEDMDAGNLDRYMAHSITYAERMPEDRTRMIKTHLPLPLLPDDLLDRAKVIMVVRNIKDVCVSYFYHHSLTSKDVERRGFEKYAEFYKSGLTRQSPFIQFVLDGWNRRGHPNLHFVAYEELKADFCGQLDKLVHFLGKSLSKEKREQLKQRVTLESFKKNKAVNKESEFPDCFDLASGKEFIRKGAVGDWKNHFSEKMNKEWDQWIEEELRDTDFKMKFE